jgi:hypothetical protein
MRRSVYFCKVLAVGFVLATLVNVTHAYEHDEQESSPQECEICFIVAQSADDGLVNEITKDPVINHKCEFAAPSNDLVGLVLLHNQSRAPPIQLISLVN